MRNGGTSGRYNGAGLPDIEISFVSRPQAQNDAGALFGAIVQPLMGCTLQSQSSDWEGATLTMASTRERGDIFSGKASLSNSIYSSASTVMPASADTLYGIYLGRSSEI